MNTTTRSTDHTPTRRRWALLRDAVVGGVVAAAATTIAAAVARGADVSLAVDAEQIPLAAFAFWSVVSALLGAGIAALARTRRRFGIIAAAGTALSLVPPVVMSDDTATTVVLVLAHLIAAAIIVPTLARDLTTS